LTARRCDSDWSIPSVRIEMQQKPRKPGSSIGKVSGGQNFLGRKKSFLSWAAGGSLNW
jgi:hypothetical protein